MNRVHQVRKPNVKKGIIAIFALAMLAVILSSCAAAFPEKEQIAALSGEEATKVLKDRPEREISDHWGEPDGMLSGFYGDIYVYNDKQIVIYYDGDSRVTDVLVSDTQD